MADRYYEITTSQRFRGVTGKSLNDRLAIMRPAGNEGAAPLQQLRHLTGRDHYPDYADAPEVQAQVWRVCEEPAAV